MKNIIDYIQKYGDLTFEEKEFNKVDALALSQFSYLKLEGKVPNVGTMLPPVTLKSIALSDGVEDLFADERYRKNNKALFDAMASSRRFADIRLNHYIDLISDKWEMQFSAVTDYLCDGLTHVLFRGTDETMIGWKEDFNMAFMTPVPAQVKAVDYLHYAAERIRGGFSVGGHSKGGNLAVYSAMKCSRLVRERITSIYSQDGPGFTKETLEDGDFDAIKDRIQKYVPHSSIIGMLFQTQEKYRVIEAAGFGIFQHDPFNWIVDDDDFVYRDDIAESFILSDEAVNKWTDEADPAKMRAFIDKVYEILVAAGVSDMNDFKGNLTSITAKAIAAAGSLDPEDRQLIKAVLGALAECFKDQIKSFANR